MPGFLRFLKAGLIDAESRSDVNFLSEHTDMLLTKAHP